MASVVKAEVLSSLLAQPLGLAQGEMALQNPFNAKATGVLVRVRNLSDRIKRQVVVIPVSHRRNANKVTKEWNSTPEWIRSEALEGRDMNIYENVIKPTRARLLWNNEPYVIDVAKTPQDEPPVKLVPEGMWDLYLGNYERMNDPDPNIRMAEIAKLAQRFAGKENPVIVRDINGDIVSGYLEFTREAVVPQSTAIDAEMLRAGEIEEV